MRSSTSTGTRLNPKRLRELLAAERELEEIRAARRAELMKEVIDEFAVLQPELDRLNQRRVSLSDPSDELLFREELSVSDEG